jgi:serine/threonine protein kinase/tetratricopeptide (TPR) repeat protein
MNDPGVEADLSQAERIDKVASAFEAAWKAGQNPRLEDWLLNIGAADRPALVKELLLLEVHYRRQGGEAVAAAEYQQRFSELDESWLNAILTASPETAVHSDAAPPDRVAPSQASPGTIRYSGDYELREELGRGGMGVVYRGHDAGLGRTLAVKVLLEKHADNDELNRRFLEEAQIMGQLQHPGVAPIHDIGRLPDGRPFFSMKQIKGQTLAELLKSHRGSAPQQPAKNAAQQHLPLYLSIFEQVGQTVAFAHGRGILHRDLKPANVMVGAFGEVQVMDWGLAKVLGPASDQRTRQLQATENTSIIFSVRTQAQDDAHTDAGRVLGTPAYMAPEQARGEVEHLDERCDVFGLGAILCEVLTGQPPFPGDTLLDSHRKAMKSDLRDAFARLEGCGADSELVALARRCLASDKEDRPRHAGEVAAALVRYQAGVRERLRQAELDRTAAQVQATEERRRRRVWLGLAAMIVLFAVAGTGVGVWYNQNRVAWALEDGRKTQQRGDLERNIDNDLTEVDQQRQSLHRELAQPLTAAKLVSDIDAWKARVDRVRETWQRAKLLADSGKELLDDSWFRRLEKVDQQIQADHKNWGWAKQLDDVRGKAGSTVEGKWDRYWAATAYLRVFHDMGLDAAAGDIASLAEKVKEAPIGYALVAALDHWTQVLPDTDPLVPRLLDIARRADPDPWRDQVRDRQIWSDSRRLLRLVQEAELDKQTPHIVHLLAWRVGQHDKAKAAELLRAARFHYPKDFWLYYFLPQVVQDQGEKIGYGWAALALRPNSAPAHINLGSAVWDTDRPGAVQHALKATEIDARFGMAYRNLGLAMAEKKDWDQAIKYFHQAIELDRNDLETRLSFAFVLRKKRDFKGASQQYQEGLALSLDRRQLAGLHNNFGACLRDDLNDVDGAIEHYQKALALDPNLAEAHYNLAKALGEGKSDHLRAIQHFEKAIEFDNKFTYAHVELGHLLWFLSHHRTDRAAAAKDLERAVPHLRKAISLNPKFAPAHAVLGLVLDQQKDLPAAVDAFQKALHLDPKHKFAAAWWHSLGNVLYDQRNVSAAIDAYRKALDIDAKHAAAWTRLGMARRIQKDLPAAIEAFKVAVKVRPDYSDGHGALGMALRDHGDFPGAVAATERALQLLPQGHNLRSYEEKQLKKCQQLLALEKRVPEALGVAKLPASEYLTLADLCLRYLKRYADAAGLYSRAFAADPKWAEQAGLVHRYNAVCAAALAAAGKGVGADSLPEPEKALLAQQARTWLAAELASRQKLLERNPVHLHEELAHWLTDADLAGMRDAEKLARQPQVERVAWRRLWGDVAALAQQARCSYTETRQPGALTATERQQTHALAMSAGNTYVIDLESVQLDAYLRLEDGQGKVLAENDDISPGNRNARIVFTPQEGGAYRVIATSYQQQGTGAYTLTIRQFAAKKP